MSSMGFDGTLGTDGGQVSFAVGIDFLMRVLLAMKNPGGR